MELIRIGANQLRNKLGMLVDRVERGDADVIVTRYLRPIVVVIPYRDYLALKSELDALRDARAVDMRAASDAPPDSSKKQASGAGTQADGSTSPQQKVSATPENESAAETYRRFNEIKGMQLGQGGGGGGENKVTLSGELRLVDMQRAVIAAVGDTGTQIPLGGRIAGMA